MDSWKPNKPPKNLYLHERHEDCRSSSLYWLLRRVDNSGTTSPRTQEVTTPSWSGNPRVLTSKRQEYKHVSQADFIEKQRFPLFLVKSDENICSYYRFRLFSTLPSFLNEIWQEYILYIIYKTTPLYYIIHNNYLWPVNWILMCTTCFTPKHSIFIIHQDMFVRNCHDCVVYMCVCGT